MPSYDRKSRVLVIGRHELACRILQELAHRPAIELAAIAARREDAGRRLAIVDAALRNSIPLLGVGITALSDALSGFRPDLLVSAGYDRILTAEAIALASRSVNVHFGMLPRYRGSYSIPWAILNNEPEIGVTLHEMTPSMDAGPIIRQEGFPNDPNTSCRDLYEHAVEIGARLVGWFVDEMLAGAMPAATPQKEELATYYPPEYPGDFKIPWRQTVTYVVNYIRAAHFPPYDGAFGEIHEQRVLFDWPVEFRFIDPPASPGTVVTYNGRPNVTTLNGLVLPGAVSMEGRRMDFPRLVSEYGLANRSFA
jgi:methionyl-tRNA formyltransferase